MKVTIVAVLAAAATPILAHPIVIARTVAPYNIEDLEARWHFKLPHINWHKVGGIAKTAAKVGAEILLKREGEDGILYARGFDDGDEQLEARDVNDLEARHHHINWHKVGGVAKTAAKIGAEILLKREDEDDLLYARGFDDDEQLEARDLEARHHHINWHKVGGVAKTAAKIGAEILLKREDEDDSAQPEPPRPHRKHRVKKGRKQLTASRGRASRRPLKAKADDLD